jgi:hypothetical protein
VACLADVARLEWACHESFRAADAPSLDLARLAAVPAEAYGALRFSLDPSVRLVRSIHPVASIWEANQPHRDGVPRGPEGAEAVLVRRSAFAVSVEALNPLDWTFLAAIAAGATLEAVAQASEAEEILTGSLARWVGEGVIAAFTLATQAA